MVATHAIGSPTATAVLTLTARLSETAMMIEPNSQAALVSGAVTLNMPRS